MIRADPPSIRREYLPASKSGRSTGKIESPRAVIAIPLTEKSHPTGTSPIVRSENQESRMLHAPTRDLDNESVTKAYARWAPVYDFVFQRVFEKGRKAAVAAADRVGGRILEVGVGTGMSLPHYSRDSRVCGIDISEPMLRKARKRIAELGLTNVEGLWVMDAGNMSFDNESFDVVVAQHVVTTVENPEATLDELARVLRRGGEIVLISRVGADDGFRLGVERRLMPVSRKLGWRTEFAWGRYARWLDRNHDIELAERRAMPPFGHFHLIRFAKTGSATTDRSG
jgi:phosphatidylethanolamine/phosphatidyl-N-methylethanolamine N-methyltransferase